MGRARAKGINSPARSVLSAPPPKPDATAWVGGRVRSHDKLERADERFWQEAGPSARVAASIDLALTAHALVNPGESVDRIDRAVGGVGRR